MDLWAYPRGVTLDFSRPGKPTDNAFNEAFNGRFRAECLNSHWFMSLEDAAEKLEAWRRDYNEERPHSSLNYIWANREHAAAILPNAYTDRAQMFPLQHGGAKAGRWVEEQRNILADYRRAFGTDPPATATVAIMADTDNTGEQVTAWVDDLVVSRHP